MRENGGKKEEDGLEIGNSALLNELGYEVGHVLVRRGVVRDGGDGVEEVVLLRLVRERGRDLARVEQVGDELGGVGLNEKSRRLVVPLKASEEIVDHREATSRH